MCLNRDESEPVVHFSEAFDSTPEKLVFSGTVTLKDEWAKIQARGG